MIHIHNSDHLRYVTNEPSGPWAGRRAGLSRDGPAQHSRGSAGSIAFRHSLQGVVEIPDRCFFEHTLTGCGALVLRMPIPILNRAHDVRLGRHPSIGEGRIALSHVDWARRRRTQDVGQVIVQTWRLGRQTGFDGNLSGVRRPNTGVELGENRVDRVLRGRH